MKKTAVASYILVVALIIAALLLKLLSALIAGFLVYTLTARLSHYLARKTGSPYSRPLALAIVLVSALAGVAGVVMLMNGLVKSHEGLPWLSDKLAEALDSLRLTLPDPLQSYLPSNVDSLRVLAIGVMKAHSETISAAGINTLMLSAHVLLGIVCGAMVACKTFEDPSAYRPLSGEMLRRLRALRESFEKVVFAQVRISALNTAFTALYLNVALPLFGIHLPLTKTLVVVTFLVGLLPVVGNLISNSVIVLLSVGTSIHAAVASLCFLVLIHKLEYFLNARIIGHQVHAAAWELILAMLAMEALFGVPGLIAAPVLYAYMKSELEFGGLIGLRAQGAVERTQAVTADI
ncbi:AI-2E family transporter [Paraburkholderia sp. UCT31]|uniref:AI-2E family transporter n=1 Tax=Paraburkholderia sp. UCT31 TaxID=2615209 RepID=UPI00292A5DA6|nr:AI-2E family transporter [Paraburkholderia sp. UCT31]